MVFFQKHKKLYTLYKHYIYDFITFDLFIEVLKVQLQKQPV